MVRNRTLYHLRKISREQKMIPQVWSNPQKNPAALLLTGGPQMTGTHLRQFGLPFDKPVTIAFD
jgi:hypothetical protein